MPRPKTSCQKRLTVTRAVSGLAGSTSHCARPRRFFGIPSAADAARRGWRLDLFARFVVFTAHQDIAIGWESFLSSWMCVTGLRALMASRSLPDPRPPSRVRETRDRA